MKFNAIHSIQDVTTESGQADEPVTDQEVKDFLRLEGFTDADESTSESLSDFDFDDDLITEQITAAREFIERKTGTHLIPKTLEVVFTNGLGLQELPGPVGEITTLTDDNGNDVLSQVKTVGNTWKLLKCPCLEYMTATYEAGYGNDNCPALPTALKQEILRCAAWFYLNRDGKPYVSQVAAKYSRNVWLA